jgi:hypothetical protein
VIAVLWELLAEQSARFDSEGFDRFTEVTAHAALAREAYDQSAWHRADGSRGPAASGNPWAKSGVIEAGRNRGLWGVTSIDDE